jgi:membrane protein YdbS with pleckstrin-like domain
MKRLLLILLIPILTLAVSIVIAAMLTASMGQPLAYVTSDGFFWFLCVIFTIFVYCMAGNYRLI